MASNLTPTLFFSELKKYNTSNYRALHSADLESMNPDIIKAFSSVITRYFIFCEKHPEISDVEKRVLYFKVNIDKVARFFSNYPDTTADDLIAFQIELSRYERLAKGEDPNAESIAV